MQQVAVRRVQLDRLDADARRAPGGSAKSCTSRAMPSASSASGGASCAACGSADGATVGQPPSCGAINWPPCHGAWLDALRPACASWMAIGIDE